MPPSIPADHLLLMGASCPLKAVPGPPSAGAAQTKSHGEVPSVLGETPGPHEPQEPRRDRGEAVPKADSPAPLGASDNLFLAPPSHTYRTPGLAICGG